MFRKSGTKKTRISPNQSKKMQQGHSPNATLPCKVSPSHSSGMLHRKKLQHAPTLWMTKRDPSLAKRMFDEVHSTMCSSYPNGSTMFCQTVQPIVVLLTLSGNPCVSYPVKRLGFPRRWLEKGTHGWSSVSNC